MTRCVVCSRSSLVRAGVAVNDRFVCHPCASKIASALGVLRAAGATVAVEERPAPRALTWEERYPDNYRTGPFPAIERLRAAQAASGGAAEVRSTAAENPVPACGQTPKGQDDA